MTCSVFNSQKQRFLIQRYRKYEPCIVIERVNVKLVRFPYSSPSLMDAHPIHSILHSKQFQPFFLHSQVSLMQVLSVFQLGSMQSDFLVLNCKGTVQENFGSTVTCYIRNIHVHVFDKYSVSCLFERRNLLTKIVCRLLG